MQTYFGTKEIKAKAMNRQEFTDYMSMAISHDADSTAEGFLVEYVNSPNSNHENHKGYISWSPKHVFINTYHVDGELTFGDALVAMKAGKAVQRKGWNGKGMFIFLTKGRTIPNDKQRSFSRFKEDTVVLADHIDMRAADGSYVSGWLASQTDMLTEDWQVYVE